MTFGLKGKSECRIDFDRLGQIAYNELDAFASTHLTRAGKPSFQVVTQIKNKRSNSPTDRRKPFARVLPAQRQPTATGVAMVSLRARYYDTETGEFGSQDPLGYVDGMSTFRGYFISANIDPYGLCERKCVAKLLNEAEMRKEIKNAQFSTIFAHEGANTEPEDYVLPEFGSDEFYDIFKNVEKLKKWIKKKKKQKLDRPWKWIERNEGGILGKAEMRSGGYGFVYEIEFSITIDGKTSKHSIDKVFFAGHTKLLGLNVLTKEGRDAVFNKMLRLSRDPKIGENRLYWMQLTKNDASIDKMVTSNVISHLQSARAAKITNTTSINALRLAQCYDIWAREGRWKKTKQEMSSEDTNPSANPNTATPSRTDQTPE